MLVISLDRRPDRYQTFLENAEAADIHPDRITRISAVDAKTFDATIHPSVSLLTAHNIRNKVRRSIYEIDNHGAVGCSLSHFKTWEWTLQSTGPAVLIFEDDAEIPQDFQKRFAKVVADLPESWDVICFYNTPMGDGATGCSTKVEGDLWYSCSSLTGSHAYLLSKRGAKRLLANAYPIELHMDAYMAFMSRMNRITMLWHPDLSIYQMFDKSDIMHGGGDILNVPTQMEAKQISVLGPQSLMGILILVAVASGILALGIGYPRRR
jgi:GR25 family glycosyltransferase involved in LPS biosynthesis